MSTEPVPFVPFTPTPHPNAVPAPPAPPPETGKGRGRGRKPAATKPVPPWEGEHKATPRQRKPREGKPAKRAAKYDLQTILRVAGTLKEADQKLFEKLLGELSALPKGSRSRILKALGEVFG